MTDHFARSNSAATSPKAARVAELHRLCDEDYAKGKQQRATAGPAPAYNPLAVTDRSQTTVKPSNLDIAISVAQQLLDSDQVLSLREALRLLLRALGAEPAQAPAGRCPAALPDDPTPCDGSPIVTVIDRRNAGVDACERHGVRLLTLLNGSYVISLPDAPAGTAARVFRAADGPHGGGQ
ncbi:hypothetical protein [Streptomyces sp. NPDC008137]|uniref:hypothetical protein n=1 Tax=Streptomyces sp. NPDC008137 TaxID=3364813 RepID=UPI0036EF75D1